MRKLTMWIGLWAACAGCAESGVETGAVEGDGLLTDGAPPSHPGLVTSAWPTAHGSAYSQGATDRSGPTHTDGVVQFVETGLVSATLTYGPENAAGECVVWGSQPSSVYKAVRTDEAVELIDTKISEGFIGNAIAGAYTVLAEDGVFYRTFGATIEAWSDDPEDVRSDFELRNVWSLADPDGRDIIGLSMTWDGTLVFATSDGQVGAIDRGLRDAVLVDLEPDEEVSNSIAVDETGGVFVVTDKALYRVQWTGERLTRDEGEGAWRARYSAGDGVRVPGRLGVGSGSTPSLMGGPDDPHRFVVITDGQALMHLALFWRDEIPDGAPLVGDGIEPRLAGAVAVTFGDPEATSSMSEQSVLVSDYRAVVVNNDYEDDSNLFAPILNGEAPLGVEQFRWDPATFTLSSAWTRDDVSCPNGIPTMSRSSNTMYCVGKRGETWNFEAFDWDTGESLFTIPTGVGLPYNSAYAATQVGVRGELISATSTGIVRYAPDGAP